MSQRPRRIRSAFTMLEMVLALVIMGVVLSVGAGIFANTRGRISARRAAQIFSQDLLLARTTALRSQEQVTLKATESSRSYTIRTAGGRVVATRRFTANDHVSVSSLDLATAGDSVVFSTRGVATLSGGGVGMATFSAGAQSYQVRFNSTGSAKIAEL
jgi:prepilin-type N-terminal cleavage/methylation domain-containing protein